MTRHLAQARSSRLSETLIRSKSIDSSPGREVALNMRNSSLSRLGEQHSPEREFMSPKTNPLRLGVNLEQVKKVSPCMSRLGKTRPPERELQVLILFYALKHCISEPQTLPNTPIQFINITLTIQQGTNAIQTPTITFHTIKVYTIQNSH